MVEWYLYLLSLAERNNMAKTLDDMIFTTAEYEPWDDDYGYLDEPDTVDSWLYAQDEAADRFYERQAAQDSLALLQY